MELILSIFTSLFSAALIGLSLMLGMNLKNNQTRIKFRAHGKTTDLLAQTLLERMMPILI